MTVESIEAVEAIAVRGARTHNLRDVDLDVPRGRLVVMAGVSGSGKSSLAFDTIFAEGQRRYIECLSNYARQFLDQLERPDVDEIDGLPPTVAIDQRAGWANPRSTVGTLTEINDHLRLLYSRLGVPHCPGCGLPIRAQTPEQMAAVVMALPEGSRLMLLAPLVRGRKGAQAEAFAAIQRAGLIRARVDGEIIEVSDEPPRLAKTKKHDVDAVVDRLVVREGIGPRLAESLALAMKLSEGLVTISVEANGAWEDRLLSIHHACPGCGINLPALEPRDFSFNSPRGACPACDGLGVITTDDDAPETIDDEVPCPACGGSRLKPEARAARVGGKSIDQVADLPIDDAGTFFDGLEFGEGDEPVAAPLLREIRSRLRFLSELGLGYLTLGRGSRTLSGGELQRVRLAAQLGSDLAGVCYVLDEPTAGLHPRDTDRLLSGLRELERRGNSLIVVEHDEAVIRAADWLIDIGPGAGPDGGQVVAAGTLDQILDAPESLTGRWLRGDFRHQHPRSDRLEKSPGWITIAGASVHNLKKDEVRIPRGTLTCVTGVSGSGKSTLVHDVLARSFRLRDRDGAPLPPELGEIDGWEAINSLIEVDQSPIGRTPRSTPATFTKLFDQIRRVFATTREARMRGYGAARFSFNAKGGRCEVCRGQGRRRIPMHFLPDLFVVCEECRGKRFNRQTLEVLFKGYSIGDVLDLRVDEARELFDAQPRVLPGLNALHDIGLGYLTLGQSSTTLSGGEAQRVKLAAQLGRASRGDALYVLDEPTTGLHLDDTRKLLDVVHRLADLGNSVVIIEHNLEVIKTADWILDLGPEAGREGGDLVVQGTPEEVAACKRGYTSKFLRETLASSPRAERPRFDPKEAARQAAAEARAARAAAKAEAEGKGSEPDRNGPAIVPIPEAAAPWERDGRKWHTEDRTARNGKPVRWDGRILALLVDRLAELGGDALGPVDWKQRGVVNIRAVGAGTDGPFFRATTSSEWIVTLRFRLPRAMPKQAKLAEALALRPFHECSPPVLSDAPRLKITSSGGRQEITITGATLADFETPAFADFLAAAVATLSTSGDLPKIKSAARLAQ